MTRKSTPIGNLWPHKTTPLPATPSGVVGFFKFSFYVIASDYFLLLTPCNAKALLVANSANYHRPSPLPILICVPVSNAHYHHPVGCVQFTIIASIASVVSVQRTTNHEPRTTDHEPRSTNH